MYLLPVWLCSPGGSSAAVAIQSCQFLIRFEEGKKVVSGAICEDKKVAWTFKWCPGPTNIDNTMPRWRILVTKVGEFKRIVDCVEYVQ